MPSVNKHPVFIGVELGRGGDNTPPRPKRLFEKSKLILALAIGNRDYTDKTRLRGLKNLNFLLVRAGGLCLCSSELYSSKTFQTSSNSIPLWLYF
ncbi:hypothetical protein NIES21_16590 [Anabaenopsis circularis NIES-21]|uniref:Uncharacterized protein n=1 Tax=Anabaenopsis circularis NIES-21 TaxID=1085406 RepID=A0A1Z4GER9_9CYAN|nr:hypothetical protein NIES21_16590 [Anabaenopsis circularis NIES-21]